MQHKQKEEKAPRAPETFHCDSIAETEAVARMFAENCRDVPMVFSLEGALGAGKTQFVKAFARALGYQGEVSSPTFVLLHEYTGGKYPIYHFDWYRLKTAEDVLEIGFEDVLGQGLVVVEWGDLFPELLPDKTWHLQFEMVGPSKRIIHWRTGQ